MWELEYKESWAQKNWCFWTVVLEKTLESPLTARRSTQSILKEINPGCSLAGLMLKLKLQHFGHLMRRADSLEKTSEWEGLGAGGEGDDRGWEGWMASPTRWTWVWVDSGSWWWTGRAGVLRFMGPQRVGHDWATELNWTVRTEHTSVCLSRGRNDRNVFMQTRETPPWGPFCASQLSAFLLATFSVASPTPFLKELCCCWKVSSSSKNSPQDAAKAGKTRAATREPRRVRSSRPPASGFSPNRHLTSWSHFPIQTSLSLSQSSFQSHQLQKVVVKL